MVRYKLHYGQGFESKLTSANKMIFAALLVVTVLSAAEAATTVTMPPTTTQMPPTTTTAAMTTQMAAKVLYDMKHHKAMIVRADGCYEYHMNHQDVMDAQNAATRPTLEARMLQELSMMVSKQEMGHHHIDHMSQEIRTACAALTVYSFTLP